MNKDPLYELLPRRFTEGDTEPPIPCVYKDQDGNPVNISGCTVELRIQRPAGVLVVTGTLTDPTNGRFEFGNPWSATDFVAGFGQVSQIELHYPGGGKLSFPRFLIDVEKRIA